jgi:hypothetical protein
MRPSILEVIDHVLGQWFRGPTWHTWKSVLKAAYALPMTVEEIALFRRVADRDPPSAPVRELVAVAGRRAGKDSIASAIAVHAALGDYSALLRPGEMATVLCLACDRDQAAIVLRYIKAYFTRIPSLAALVTRDTLEGFELANNVEIVVGTNDYRSVRGRAIVCAILSEAAFYPRDAASSDKEVIAALTPSLATLPGSLLVIISTPHMKGGILYDKWSHSFGKPDTRTLVVHGGTRAFNESIDQAVIDEDLALDPQRASAEWLAEWRADLDTFIDPEMIAALTERGVVVRPPLEGVAYVAFCDASSGRGDSFTCAIAHRDGDKIILDAVMVWRSPFAAAQVVGECADFVRGYRLHEVWGDRYAVGFTIAIFAEHGITYRENIMRKRADGTEQALDRSMIYLSWLPLATSGRVVLLDLPRMASQFVALERRAFPSGNDKIQHPDGKHDDIANSVAGAMVLASHGDDDLTQWQKLGRQAREEQRHSLSPDLREHFMNGRSARPRWPKPFS